MNRTFGIKGMHCNSCAMNIENNLKKLAGIKKANVNFALSNLSLEYDDKIMPLNKIQKKISGLGYELIETTNISKSEIEEQNKYKRLFIFSLIFTLPAFIIGMILMPLGIEIPYAEFILFVLSTPVQFIVGKQFYFGMWGALKNKTANMDTLIAIGTTAAYLLSVYNIMFNPGAGQYFETSAILITLVVLGKYLEAIAKGKTSEAIKKLMNLSPKIAIVIRNKKELQISVDDIVLGDIILVKPGEKIPVDGIIIEGYSSVDESIITGESIPVEKTINSNVIGGSINKHGTFKFKTTKVGKDTTLSHIIKLIEDAQTKKAPIQRYADKISSYFVPVVILISIFTFIIWYFIIGSNLSFALLTSVAVLVIACPCALGLATPTAIMVGSGLGAKYGILIKGGDSLETAHKLKYVLFDKTGTITNGKPIVTNIIEINAKENEILMIAASLEKKSEHSLAESIIKFAEDKNVKLKTISNFEALPGFGITGEINNEIYYFGNRKLIHSKKLPCENKREVIETLESEGKTVMLLANTKKILGIIAVADTIKLSSKDAIKSLNKLGIETYMITGDNLRTAKAIAKQAGINENNVFAEVLPKDKANHVKQLQAKGQKVAMIGDGINDSPALAQADIGIVMGSGTDIAMESGNIVLMQNNLTDIPKAIKLSKFTISKIKQNMFWALIYNVIGIPIAAGALYFAGITLSPIIAGSAMALSSVSVVSSSILLKYRKL